MRILAPATLVLLALSGCAQGGGDACEDIPASRAVVESIDGRDALVRLEEGGLVQLHLSAAVFVQEGGTCEMTGPAGVRVGDTVAFHVDEMADSYPPQAWPETTFVLR